MQLYALELKGHCIHARNAIKQHNYFCVECKQIVRLRGGPHRQSHFYHLDSTPFCRQHQKGIIHLHLQTYFFNHLPSNDCMLEYHFPEVNRIADVAWLSEKIIFEIQYSPISAEEVLQRNQDYFKMGWTVVWILHDHRFNQIRVSAAEMALRSSPHYYSNMDSNGRGIIYDQFDQIRCGIRKNKLFPLIVDVTVLKKTDPECKTWISHQLIRIRALQWTLSFEGDLLSQYMKDPDSDYFKKIFVIEFENKSTEKFNLTVSVRAFFKRLARFYSYFLKHVLEKACR